MPSSANYKRDYKQEYKDYHSSDKEYYEKQEKEGRGYQDEYGMENMN